MTATHTTKSKKQNGVSNGALAMADNMQAFDPSLPMAEMQIDPKPSIEIAAVTAKRDQLAVEKKQIEDALANLAASTKQYHEALSRTDGALFILNDMLRAASAS